MAATVTTSDFGHRTMEILERVEAMNVNDAWIAATAIALGMPVVTQDDDFAGAPLVEIVQV